MVMIIPKIQEKKDGCKHLNLPVDICKLKNWKKGTVLEFRERNGDVYLVEIR
jgi:hypothetical protein